MRPPDAQPPPLGEVAAAAGSSLGRERQEGTVQRFALLRGGGTAPSPKPVPLEVAAAKAPLLSITDLAWVVSPKGVYVDSIVGRLAFQCPLHTDHVAFIDDEFFWSCPEEGRFWAARYRGTRYQLERVAIENAEYLERLANRLAQVRAS